MRTTTIDPLAEKYYSISPYAWCGNNSVRVVDPDGRTIYVYHWVSDNNGGGTWKKGHLNDNTQKLLETFAKTEVGFKFLSQFAKAGQKIGDIEFKKDGKFANHNLNFNEYDSYGSDAGTYSMQVGKSKLNFNINLNSAYMKDSNGKANYAITVGHEIFLHTKQVYQQFINLYNNGNETSFNELYNKQKADDKGNYDHSRYINGNSSYEEFNNYVIQLKQLLKMLKLNLCRVLFV